MQKCIAIFWLTLLFISSTLSPQNQDYIGNEKGNHVAVTQSFEVNGQQLKYATAYTRVGMHSELIAYEDYQTVADLYNLLQLGQLREVPEPQTSYGALFEIWDYYIEKYIIGFYEDQPIYEESQNAINAKFSFIIYTMLEGEPEFGNDSKYLLFDAHTSKWYVFSEEQYNKVIDLLENSEKTTLFDVSV